MIGSQGQGSQTQYYWACSRTQSACWVVFDAALACCWLLGPTVRGTTAWVVAALFALAAAPHAGRLFHPAGTCLSDGGVHVRTWVSRWRQVEREQVRYVEISTGRADSTLLLTDGSRVRMPGLPVEAARALAFDGPASARRLTTARR